MAKKFDPLYATAEEMKAERERRNREREAKRKAEDHDVIEREAAASGRIAILDPNGGAILPDGSKVSAFRAFASGYDTIDVRAMAARLGYVAGTARDAVAADIASALKLATPQQQGAAFTAAVLNLPEAKDRPAAAAKIAAAYAGSWSVDKAQQFLAGLPTEVADDTGTAPANPGARGFKVADESRLRRMVEIRCAALSFNQSRGMLADNSELQALRYTLEAIQHGSSVRDALVFMGLDPANYERSDR